MTIHFRVVDAESAVVEMWAEEKYMRNRDGKIYLNNIECGPLVLPLGGRIEIEAV